MLEQDIREDDSEESVLAALRMIKGVIDVKPVVNEAGAAIERTRAEHEIGRKLLDFYRENLS